MLQKYGIVILLDFCRNSPKINRNQRNPGGAAPFSGRGIGYSVGGDEPALHSKEE